MISGPRPPAPPESIPPARRARWLGDISGGVIAAMIALPYALAMAALMGIPPVYGIFTSIIGVPFIVLLGRNPVLIGGTASATVPFIAQAVQRHGLAGAAFVTVMASVVMIGFSVGRLGRHIMRIPHAIISGFSCGIGALMIASQLHLLLGVRAPSGMASALQQAWFALSQVTDTHGTPLLIGGVVILTAMACARRSPLVPAPLIGLLAAIALTKFLSTPVKEVGSIQFALPPWFGREWTLMETLELLPMALGLALVASINILMTSRVVEHFRGRHQHMHPGDADAELRAYGVANLVGGFFGAPPSVGIPARSLAVVKCGGTTRAANIFHALVLIAVLTFGAGLVARIPLPALAGVTIWMGIGLLNWSTWRRLPKMRSTDSLSFLLTALLVLCVNSVMAVLCGCAFYAAHRWYARRLFRRTLSRHREARAADAAQQSAEDLAAIQLEAVE